MSIMQMLLASGVSRYLMDKSLRFRASASAYLNRTPVSAGNRQTWTWSGWVKRGALGTMGLFSTINSGSVNTTFGFNSDVLDFLEYQGATVARLVTTQVFRDPSAWYHIVAVWDSSNATSTERVRLYVNGSRITAFATASYPTQNLTSIWNNNVSSSIGTYNNGAPPQLFFDGYLADVYFIDGQALTPSSFGSTNALTGVWQPKAYTGTYGTNGFYLDFETTTSVSALGNDKSGNGNTWTVNNISLTAGVTYDSMTDVPTLTSETVANYCVLNPLDSQTTGLGNTPSNGNLRGSGTTYGATFYSCTFQVPKYGKWYWETIYSTIGSTSFVGVRSYSTASTDVQYGSNGNKVVGGSSTAYGSSWTTGDVIAAAVDRDAGTVTFYKNNVLQGAISIPNNLAAFDIAFANASPFAFTSFDVNFGQRPFAYTPPTGFKALNTYNLLDSAIVAGNKYFDATTYTGTGAIQTITNSGSMQPDFVWIKSRSGTTWNNLYDSVRGVNKALYSNDTFQEFTDTNLLTSFNSNGFSIGNSTVLNTNAATFVAWQWQAGQGSSSSNTNGTITSTVSVNATAGFSVVTYTGTGSAATVGHGLGVAPKMVIVKRRNTTGSWVVWQSALAGTEYLLLNLTNAKATAPSVWNSTVPTSSVVSIGTDTAINASASTYVAYCFAEIDGYSKFGSYVGNGSADGPFVYLGFRPRWIMVKQASGTDAGSQNWQIIDTARDTYNVSGLELYANLSNAQSSNVSTLDATSNGFKVRTTNGGWNVSGGTYIYAAFAESPFKNSLAR